MGARPLPARNKLTVCFAHVAYCMGERFALRNTGLDWFEVRSLEDLKARIEDVDVLVCSFLWRNELIPAARRLAFIQSISAGTDQYSRDALAAAGIRVASAQGVNERAVAEHAIALILAMARQIPQARDNQSAKTWRGMIGDTSKREDELGRQDAAGRRPGSHWHAVGCARQGVRHARDRRSARSIQGRGRSR